MKMNRIKEAWFEFKGKRSDEMGIMLRGMGTRFAPGTNVERKKVAGRNGGLKYGPRTYNDVQVRIECDVRDESRLTEILGWLTGEGLLRFSDAPGFAYEASVEKEYSYAQIMNRYMGQRFTITWTCAPFRRLHPEVGAIAYNEPGIIENPGTAPALPLIKIVGSGDFSLTIGMQTVFFRDVDGGIIIDSELGDALTLNGAQLANDKMDGPLFEIQPGYNPINWTVGSEDDEGNAIPGNVSQVTVTPRWRYI